MASPVLPALPVPARQHLRTGAGRRPWPAWDALTLRASLVLQTVLETGMVTGVAAGAVRAAGGISTSRGVGIAVVCAAAALATATAASTAA